MAHFWVDQCERTGPIRKGAAVYRGRETRQLPPRVRHVSEPYTLLCEIPVKQTMLNNMMQMY